MKLNTDLIKLQIACLGLTQEQFAEKADLSRVGFSTILSRQTCHPNSLLKIANAMGVDPQELLVS